MSLHDSSPSGKSPGNSHDVASARVPSPSLTPDRRRIDSDVRAFLRQPSTPWITFDKDGRPSRHSIAPLGEVFTSARSSILIGDMFGALPTAPAVTDPNAVEPSSLVVASDVVDPVDAGTPRLPAMSAPDAPDATDANAFARPSLGRRAAAVGAGLAGVLAVGALVFGLGGTSGTGAAPAKATFGSSVQNAQTGADLPPPDFSASANATPTPKPAPAPAATAAPKFARLTIAGNAQRGFVFLDGKRLLGKGDRSFTVTCGVHQIAVGERTAVREVDVPCNAEYVVDGSTP